LAQVAQVIQSLQNMAAHIVTGARRCDRISPILQALHWLPVSQRVVFQTSLMVWKCIHGVVPVYLNDLYISGRQNLRCASSRTLLVPHAVCGEAAKFRRQRTDHLEQCVVCTTSTRAVTERFHTVTRTAGTVCRLYYEHQGCQSQNAFTPSHVHSKHSCSRPHDIVETFLRDSGAEYKWLT